MSCNVGKGYKTEWSRIVEVQQIPNMYRKLIYILFKDAIKYLRPRYHIWVTGKYEVERIKILHFNSEFDLFTPLIFHL